MNGIKINKKWHNLLERKEAEYDTNRNVTRFTYKVQNFLICKCEMSIVIDAIWHIIGEKKKVLNKFLTLKRRIGYYFRNNICCIKVSELSKSIVPKLLLINKFILTLKFEFVRLYF